MQIYYEDFKTAEDVAEQFGEWQKPIDLTGCYLIYAEYTYENYEGSALVLFEKGGTLFEVNGSHCSCYGLKGQWEPEATSAEAILARPNVPNAAKDNVREYFKVH